MFIWAIVLIVVYLGSMYYLYRMLVSKLEKENNVLSEHINFLRDKVAKSADLESKIKIIFEWYRLQTKSLKKKYSEASKDNDEALRKLLTDKLSVSERNERNIETIKNDFELIKSKIEQMQSILSQDAILKSAVSYRILTEGSSSKMDKFLLEELLRELINLPENDKE